MILKGNLEMYDDSMTMQEYKWPFKVNNNIDGCYKAATACIQLSENGDIRDSYVNKKCHEVNNPYPC